MKASESDVIIILASVEPDDNKWGVTIHYDPESLSIASKAKAALLVVNKTDLLKSDMLVPLMLDFQKKLESYFPTTKPEVHLISCTKAKSTSPGDPGGIECAINSLVEIFKQLTDLPPDSQDLFGVTERQSQLLDSCAGYLKEYQQGLLLEEGKEFDLVVAAEQLRGAASCLSKITGRGDANDVEEVLGVVFEK